MKANFIKIVVPAFAIVLAVAVSAFTVSHEGKTDGNTLIQGYIASGNQSDPCNEVLVNCQIEGDNSCEYMEDVPAFRIEGPTSCKFQLSRIAQ